MKKLIIALLLYVIALEGFAQSRGYEGNVYLGGVSCFNENFGTGVEFATTHGVATADGAFLGGGIGAIVGMGLTDDDCYLSVFMQMK